MTRSRWWLLALVVVLVAGETENLLFGDRHGRSAAVRWGVGAPLLVALVITFLGYVISRHRASSKRTAYRRGTGYGTPPDSTAATRDQAAGEQKSITES